MKKSCQVPSQPKTLGGLPMLLVKGPKPLPGSQALPQPACLLLQPRSRFLSSCLWECPYWPCGPSHVTDSPAPEVLCKWFFCLEQLSSSIFSPSWLQNVLPCPSPLVRASLQHPSFALPECLSPSAACALRLPHWTIRSFKAFPQSVSFILGTAILKIWQMNPAFWEMSLCFWR